MVLAAQKFCAGSLVLTLMASAALAQLDDEVPHATYYLAVEAFYAGDYRTAERELRRETRRGIRTPQARWIDSICYHAMLGEVLYHQGRNGEALAEFDQACQLLLAYPDWLLRVKFQQPPRPDINRARRVPPWGRSRRQFTLAQLGLTEQVLIGDFNAARVLQEGGVLRSPMLWRINVLEVVRTSALAVRRRSEILGPLAPHDPITRQLVDVLGRGNLAPPNHWSRSWIDLLRGLAHAGMGKTDEADLLIGRALVIDGQFDYPLTCVVLFEQGRLAMLRGDHRRAADLLAEASFSAYYYENWDVVAESLYQGWLNHLASGGAGVYPPLEPAIAWAQLNRLNHIAVKLRLAQAESLLWLGQADAAAALLEESARRIGEMRAALPGIHLVYLQAAWQLGGGQLEPALKTLAHAIALQSAASLRNFQIARTSEMYDAHAASPRVALDLYSALLADPTPADWAYRPLDSLAVLNTPHDAAFDRWFLAALERKDLPLALLIAERSKRRRFLALQPLGGRLLALRTILELPDADLSLEAVLQRQQILLAFPAYKTLADSGQKLFDQLRASPILPPDAAEAKTLSSWYDAWEENIVQRQRLLALLAVRRLPSVIEFPPLLATAELQQSLREDEALLVFHNAAGSLHAFLLTNSALHTWSLPDLRRLRAALGDFLRALGNYGPSRTFTLAELQSNDWRKSAAELYQSIFADARLDLKKISSLRIVPDDLLWYLPFDTLLSTAAPDEPVLADRLDISYGPTAALALSSKRPGRRPQHTGIVANQSLASEEEADREDLLQQLEQVVPGPLRLPSPLPEPPHLVAPLLDMLIRFDDAAADRPTVSAVALLPHARATEGALATWFGLPAGGPERVVFTGLATEAEQALKTPRRGSRAMPPARPGDEIFHSLCDLMARGARTILFTRWRTGGKTNYDLVREFVQELPHASALEAWQRARLLAREAPLDLAREPRIKRSPQATESPSANHPFFWAGYLLVDNSPWPESEEPTADPLADQPPQPAPAETPAAPSSIAAPQPEDKADAPASIAGPNLPTADAQSSEAGGGHEAADK